MKTASFGQGLALTARVAECFPRDIPPDELQVIIDDPNFWKEFLGGVREAYAARIPTIPAVGEEFELTLYPITGLDMVVKDGHFKGSWNFEGSEITEPRTGRFRLIQVGECCDLYKVMVKLAEHGTVPAGQWREAFKSRFTKPDGNGPIGFADPSWIGPGSRRFFPFITNNHSSDFRQAAKKREAFWRWLVQVG